MVESHVGRYEGHFPLRSDLCLSDLSAPGWRVLSHDTGFGPAKVGGEEKHWKLVGGLEHWFSKFSMG